MKLSHFFNRYQEQFTYFFTALFVAIIAAFYFWGISIISAAIAASLETGATSAPPTHFNFTSLKDIPVLNTSSTSP